MRRLIVGLSLALLCAGLHAQTMNLRGTIPFAFRAGDTQMPAGDYTIRHSANQLILHKEGGGPSVLLLTIAASRPNALSEERLSFNRYGERYFLSSVWTSESREGREVPKSRAEKEVARQAGLPQSAGVVLKRQ